MTTVTSGADSGPGTLRQAILDGFSTITVASGLSIVLSSELTINSSVAVLIFGNGATISPANNAVFVNGYMVRAVSGSVNFQNVFFVANPLVNCGVVLQESGVLEFTICGFSSFNALTNDIVNAAGYVEFFSSNFSGNEGPCCVRGRGEVTNLRSCYFSENYCTEAIILVAGTVSQSATFDGVDLTNNSLFSSMTHSAIISFNSFTPDTLINVNLRNITISENIVNTIAGIYCNTSRINNTNWQNITILGKSPSATRGGFVLRRFASDNHRSNAINMTNCRVIDMEVGTSAGIFINYAGNTAASTINITSSSFSRNIYSVVEPGIAVTGELVSVNLTNSTIAGNTSLGMAISKISGDPDTFNNSSIALNTGGGLRISQTSVPPILTNTMVAENTSNGAFYDISGTVNSGSTYNLISSTWGLTGMTDPSNKVNGPTGLGTLGYYGGLSNMLVVPLLEGSPAINGGTNAVVTATYDNRGSPFARIIGNIVDIGAFEYQTFVAPCFTGDSLVNVRVIATGETKYIRVDQVKALEHDVYDVQAEYYVPIVTLVKVLGAKSAYLIQQGLLKHNQPFADLTITAGHPILHNDKPVKAKNVPGAIEIAINEPVYSIVCKSWCPIDVNGIGVYAWSSSKWQKHANKNGIVYECQ